jgi:hypothetical protein
MSFFLAWHGGYWRVAVVGYGENRKSSTSLCTSNIFSLKRYKQYRAFSRQLFTSRGPLNCSLLSSFIDMASPNHEALLQHSCTAQTSSFPSHIACSFEALFKCSPRLPQALMSFPLLTMRTCSTPRTLHPPQIVSSSVPLL